MSKLSYEDMATPRRAKRQLSRIQYINYQTHNKTFFPPKQMIQLRK